MNRAYQFREIRHRAVILENALGDDEPTSQGPTLLLCLLLNALQHIFKALQVVMVIPPNGASRDLDTLLDCEVDTAVRDNDIPTFCEGCDDGRDCCESLRVDDSRFSAEEGSQVTFEVNVNICFAKKSIVSTKHAGALNVNERRRPSLPMVP